MSEREEIQGNAGKRTHDVVFDLLRERVASGRVMDIPCGHGVFTKRLVDAGYSVVAADVECVIDVDGVEFQRADMNHDLPLESDSLDAAICIEGIEHLERPVDFVRECGRVVKPGGWIVITTPNTSALRSRWRWFLTGFHNKAKYALDETDPNPSHHIRMFSYPELRYVLHTNGFEIEQVTTNRIKGMNWLYAPWIPIQYLVTRFIIARAKDQDINRPLSREVLQHMTSLPVLLGESLIVAARKKS